PSPASARTAETPVRRIWRAGHRRALRDLRAGLARLRAGAARAGARCRAAQRADPRGTGRGLRGEQTHPALAPARHAHAHALAPLTVAAAQAGTLRRPAERGILAGMAALEQIIATELASWSQRPVEHAIFGHADPARIARELERCAAELLGTRVSSGLFYHAS